MGSAHTGKGGRVVRCGPAAAGLGPGGAKLPHVRRPPADPPSARGRPRVAARLLAACAVVGAATGLAACGGSGGTTTTVAYRFERCDQFRTWSTAQAALRDGTGSPRGLDADGDGVACSVELAQDEYAGRWTRAVAASCRRIFARSPGRALRDAGGHTWVPEDCTSADPGPRGWTPDAAGDPAADGAADAAVSACRSFFALAGPRLTVPETGAVLTTAVCPRRPRPPTTTTITTGTAPAPATTDTATTVPGSVTVTIPDVTATAPTPPPAPAPTTTSSPAPTPTPPPATTTRAAVPALPPEARASDCTGTAAGHRIAVVRTGGSVICSGALALWSSYLSLAPTRGQGSAAVVDLYGWRCVAGEATSRRQGGCSSATRSGSFDVYRLS